MQRICCLMVNGGALDEEMRTTLFLEGFRMFHEKRTKARVKTSGMEGMVTQCGNYGSLGVFAGPIFHAEIEHGSRRIRAEFIIDSDVLAAVGPEEIEELSAMGMWQERGQAADVNGGPTFH